MGDGTNIQVLQAEIDAVAKQMQTVEANSKAVESAIVAKGTFRGYHGEDLFLKHNLGTVQAEMVKQLLRRDRGLNVQKRELLDRLGPDAAAVGGELARCAGPVNCSYNKKCHSTTEYNILTSTAYEFFTSLYRVFRLLAL